MTRAEFLDKPDFYGRMIAVLEDTKYPAKGDYSYMTPAQAKAIKKLEIESDAYRVFSERRDEAMRQALIEKFPEKKLSIEMATIKISPEMHKLLIEKARNEGKPVSPEEGE